MIATITNFHRAAWAGIALATFIAETDNTTISRLSSEDLGNAVSDLVCDLLHFANQKSLNPEHVVAQAKANYEAELVEALS